ncbi:MAG: hypothetical protein ACREMZ_07375 [Gemmatimonadales bacterium]
MREIGSRGRNVGFAGGSGVLVAWVVLVFGTGCDERDRLTFPSPGDGAGPVTTIDQPDGPDTTVSAGPDFFVNGRTMDPDGVDTVYFLVIGGNQNFNPFHPDPPAESVRFGLPITTTGHSGETFTVQIYGVDPLGNRGDVATRQIHIR